MSKQPITPKEETAFPISYESNDSTVTLTGMSLRDYFAAKALAGYLVEGVSLASHESCDAAARKVYKMADAMLKARTE